MRRADVEVYAKGFAFPEGPTWHDSSLWISDVLAGGVARLGADGGIASRMLEGRRGIGGLISTVDGRLLATGRDLVDVATGLTVMERPPGTTGLNDLGVDGTGALLVGILTYRPLAGDTPTPGTVARLDGSATDWRWFTSVEWPNGIGVLKGGDVIVADHQRSQLWRIDPEGRSGRVICRTATGRYDGLCIGDDDDIWVATGPGGTLERRHPTGRLLDEFELPARFVTSVCFSGLDPSILLVTVAGCDLAGDAGAVLAITVDTTGHPPPPARTPTSIHKEKP